MSFHGKSLLWCVALLAAAWGGSHLILKQGRGEDAVAEFGGQTITRLQLQEALRNELWHTSASWEDLSVEARQQTRSRVLEALIDERLVRASRVIQHSPLQVPPASVRRESDMIRRQFAETDAFAGRLAGQQHTLKSLETAIQDAQLDEAWLAQKIAPSLSEITPRAVRAWYDEFKETLRIPQAHHAAHIFLMRREKGSREGEIGEILRQLGAKEKTFAELAVTRSEDARTKALGGDLGWFTRERMPADLMAAVEKLEVGKVSAPVTTKLGWHLIFVRERHRARVPAFEEVKAEIHAHLTTQARHAAVQKLRSAMRLRLRPLVYYQPVIEGVMPD